MRDADRVTVLFQNSVDTTNRAVTGAGRGVDHFGSRVRDLTVTLAAARYAIETSRLPAVMGGRASQASAEVERTSFLLRGLSKELTDVAGPRKPPRTFSTSST